MSTLSAYIPIENAITTGKSSDALVMDSTGHHSSKTNS